MEYTYLGRTGLQVSRLCLGTVNFGRHTSAEDSLPVLSRALQAGINFFDTANIYNEGLTETIVGNWLAEAPIIGPRTIEQLEENLSVLALKLDDEVLAKLDEIWVGPGGDAPEAYAW